MIWIPIVLVLGLTGAFLLLTWGTRWGSTPAERAQRMPGDEWLEGGPRAVVAMTRAVSIGAPPERVWPWIAQLGRGAGWYSIDALDNGRRVSAWHIVSWIPAPRLGDASAIGYVRHIETSRALAWWTGGGHFGGAQVRLVTCWRLEAAGEGTRLISRMSADAAGATAQLALFIFRVLDSIMARRQLLGIRDRVEYWESERAAPRYPETGARDQYQYYEVLYAAGGSAGVAGTEQAARWRQSALEDGILELPEVEGPESQPETAV